MAPLNFLLTDLDDVTVFLLHPAFIHFNETTVGIDVVNFGATKNFWIIVLLLL